MTLRIYNTLTKTKEEFVPLQEGRVGMYVCGVTVYDRSHIGHARAAVVFDVIYRFLRNSGYAVTYVRNFTDVDDKIIRRAQEEGVPAREIAERYIRQYGEDMSALGVEPPTFEPRATQHIAQIISLTERLIERGFAYVVEGDVYFAVDRFPAYGQLSGRDLEEMRAGARVEVDERKRNPLDFALWKAAKPGEPEWDSPWGRGRPGWHIECSAMSQYYLGPSFDIHGGGKDLIFPHHENEIAQSQSATGLPFVRYWVHNGFVNINQEKMSKSLGNILAVRDLLPDHHPEVLRLFLLSSHYRSPLDFSFQQLAEARTGLDRFYTALEGIERITGREEEAPSVRNPQALPGAGPEVREKITRIREKFLEAMSDDFNTALALGHLHELARSLNRALGDKAFLRDPAAASLLALGRRRLFEIGGVLGLFREGPADYFAGQRRRFLQAKGLREEEVRALIEERDAARKGKQWARADEIREQAKALGISLEDASEGTTWRPA